MFAYSMASAQLSLKHSLLSGLMTGCMVGWPKSKPIDLQRAFAQSSNNSISGGASSCFVPHLHPPVFLHYCQHYSSEGSTFGKRAVPHTILDCDAPFVVSVPGLQITNQVDHATGAKHSTATLSWNALAKCAVTRAIKHAREASCPPIPSASATSVG